MLDWGIHPLIGRGNFDGEKDHLLLMLLLLLLLFIFLNFNYYYYLFPASAVPMSSML